MVKCNCNIKTNLKGNIMGKEFLIEEHAEEINQLYHELQELIDYDEWAGREYGETKVDYYWTAFNIIKAGYRKQ